MRGCGISASAGLLLALLQLATALPANDQKPLSSTTETQQRRLKGRFLHITGISVYLQRRMSLVEC